MDATLLVLLGSLLQGSSEAPRPPGQPAQGPGGSEYAHASVKKTLVGEGARVTWIFEPADPAPERAPLVVFLHGFAATNPRIYGGWIDHLVRQGRIVLYPRYQKGLLPRPETFTQTTLDALKEALSELAQGQHARIDSERVAVVGHSVGGLLAANVAALSQAAGLPVPRAIFAVEPGDADIGFGGVELADLSGIPSGSLLLALVGDADSISGEEPARAIYRGASNVPSEDKDLVMLVSDAHGTPPLNADHLVPVATDDRYHEEADYTVRPAQAEMDALDFYGTWKLFDALCDAAFDGENRAFALGNTPEQRFMGLWSDGVPVQELVVRDPSPADASEPVRSK